MNFRKLLRYVPTLLISLTVVYAGFILYFILKYGVDVPYNDQWEYVSFFDHLAKGTLTFNELFKFQGDYRQFFPNLIFIGLGSLTKWNVKYEMVLIFIMVCWISYNIYRLASYTMKAEKWQKWGVLLLANIFIFSPFQYENWLFGVQIEYFMPILCITTGMVVAYSNINKNWKLVWGIVLSVISIYSSANGLICWFILFPVFYFVGPDTAYFRKWKITIIWWYAAIITILIYFSGYKTPMRHPSMTLFFDNPGDAIKYFFGVLGNPFRIVHKLETIIVVGSVIFSIFILLIIYFLKHFRDKQLFQSAIVWIMLGFYSLGTSAMLTAGRLGFGLVQSTTPRYTSYTLYLIVSILFLIAIMQLNYARRVQFTYIHKAVLAILIGMLLYNRYYKYRDSVTDLKAFHTSIQHGKAGLLLINYISHQE